MVYSRHKDARKRETEKQRLCLSDMNISSVCEWSGGTQVSIIVVLDGEILGEELIGQWMKWMLCQGERV